MPGQYTDRALTCVECNADFSFTAGEQERHAELGFTNEPKRCAPCRAARKGRTPGGGQREMHITVCAECGGEAKVPFVPRNDKPVYCSSCFESKRSG